MLRAPSPQIRRKFLRKRGDEAPLHAFSKLLTGLLNWPSSQALSSSSPIAVTLSPLPHSSSIYYGVARAGRGLSRQSVSLGWSSGSKRAVGLAVAVAPAARQAASTADSRDQNTSSLSSAGAAADLGEASEAIDSVALPSYPHPVGGTGSQAAAPSVDRRAGMTQPEQPSLADEEDFLGAVVAAERVSEWLALLANENMSIARSVRWGKWRAAAMQASLAALAPRWIFH